MEDRTSEQNVAGVTHGEAGQAGASEVNDLQLQATVSNNAQRLSKTGRGLERNPSSTRHPFGHLDGSEYMQNELDRDQQAEAERRERELKQLAASLGDLEGKTKQQVLNLIASKKEEMLRDQDGEKPALWTDASEDDVLETLVTGSKMSWQQPMNIRDAGCCVRKGYCCFNKYHDTLQLTETNNSTMHEELSQTSHQSSNSMLSEAGSKFCCSCIGKGDEESSYREDTFPLASGQQLRRLAAIPVSGSTAPLEVQQVDVAESSSLSVPLLGAASAAVVCIGCALRRRFMQLKRRDSFGFLADSQRPSLNAAELAV